MGIILLGLIGVSTVYLIGWLVRKFESWSSRIERASSEFAMIQALKVVVIVTVVIVALIACLIAAMFDYSTLFK